MEVNGWEIRIPHPDRAVDVGGDEHSLSISVTDSRYTAVICRRRTAALSDRFYSLSAETLSEGLTYRFLYIFYDADGRELAKGYFMKGRPAVSPANTVALAIEVLITSEGGGSLLAKDILLTDGGAYVKRMARIVALSSFVTKEPGEVWHRSYEESVRDTLASIDLVAEAEHPDMIVLTENVFQTRTPTGSYYGNPNRLDGSDPAIAALCERAKKYHTYVTCSVHELDGEGLEHNTGLLIDREGRIAGIYRKCHLTVGELEWGIHPGNELCVFDTDFARIGIQICWDHYFPESTRALAMQGAELFCIPTHGSHIERAITRARENGAWLAAAHTTREATFITAPGADPLLDTGEGKGYAVADIDFNDPARRRWLSCNSYGAPYEYYMCERREDLYTGIPERVL